MEEIIWQQLLLLGFFCKIETENVLFDLTSSYHVDLGLDLQRACAQESHPAPAQRAHPETASTPATLQRQRTPLTW